MMEDGLVVPTIAAGLTSTRRGDWQARVATVCLIVYIFLYD